MRDKRITISLREQEYNILKEMSELGAGSMSKQVSELIETVTPVLSQILQNMKLIEKAKENVLLDIKGAANKGLVEAEKIQNMAFEFHDGFSKELFDLLNSD